MDITTQRKRSPGGGSKPRMIAVGKTLVARRQDASQVMQFAVIYKDATMARAVDQFGHVWEFRVETPAQ